ncbi:Latrophilin 1, partial [Brachionus plicatilis]
EIITKCEGEKVKIKCDKKRFIFVRSVQLRLNDPRCEKQTDPLKCDQKFYSLKSSSISELCRNKTTCSFRINNKLFGDECNGDKRHVTLTFVCSRFPIGSNNNIIMPFEQNSNSNEDNSSEEKSSNEKSSEEDSSDDENKPNNKNIEKYACENEFLNIECPADRIIKIKSARFERRDFSVCASNPQSISGLVTNVLCRGLNVKKLARTQCNGKRRCRIDASVKFLGLVCPDVKKYLTVRYRCQPRPKSNNPCSDNPCGFGAICKNVNRSPVCSCPSNSVGDPNVRCCKSLKCGCWGDPHCTTFDKAKFDFMGKCKYDLVSTDCYNQSLVILIYLFYSH